PATNHLVRSCIPSPPARFHSTLSSSHCLTTLLFYFPFFFFNDTATPEIYTLSLHDALPISRKNPARGRSGGSPAPRCAARASPRDRKSTRLNSSHLGISYAVFCLKKKKKKTSNKDTFNATRMTLVDINDNTEAHIVYCTSSW